LYQPGGFNKGRYYSINVQLAHIPALVVAVGHAEHRAAGGTRGLGIIYRVADHQHLGRRDAESPARMQQLRGVGFFPRQGITGDDALELTSKLEVFEKGPRKALRLVGDAREGQLHRSQPLQPFAHAGIDHRVPAVDFPIAALVDR
jgi:hypothetical protein